LVPTQPTPQSAVEWQSFRLTGQDALAVRASKKLKNDELLVTSFGSARLRMELDRVPLWRLPAAPGTSAAQAGGDHVAIRQLVEDFGRYLYLPRVRGPEVLLGAIRDGFSLLTWEKDSFAYAESYDEGAGRYRGLRGGQQVSVIDADAPGLLVKSEIARKQLDAETKPAPTPPVDGREPVLPGPGPDQPIPKPPEAAKPKRFHGSVALDPNRVGRDAGRIADEVISHLAGLVGANVTVTLEIEAEIPNGAPDNVVRTVTENSRTLKFKNQGFEKE
ncbi:MAG: AAA+ family ATPase, partial [Candidatus Binatia bacterium]